jgi:HEAT repeat protein
MAAPCVRNPESPRLGGAASSNFNYVWDIPRRHALYRLGELGDPKATPVLIEALSAPGLADARVLVVTALTRAGDARALPRLMELAASSPVLGVETAIAAVTERG